MSILVQRLLFSSMFPTHCHLLCYASHHGTGLESKICIPYFYLKRIRYVPEACVIVSTPGQTSRPGDRLLQVKKNPQKYK